MDRSATEDSPQDVCPVLGTVVSPSHGTSVSQLGSFPAVALILFPVQIAQFGPSL